eukprot:5434089-Amphidinium_carterae.2
MAQCNRCQRLMLSSVLRSSIQFAAHWPSAESCCFSVGDKKVKQVGTSVYISCPRLSGSMRHATSQLSLGHVYCVKQR